MKLHLSSFKCQLDDCSEIVTIIDDTDFRHLINSEDIRWHQFNPDFVNEAMDQFIFRTQNDGWQQFIDNIYAYSSIRVVLHEVETPEDFDIQNYYSSNSKVIQYILFPKDRNKTFLMQSQNAIGDAYFIKTLHKALSNPKKSKINSLYKLKMLWNSLRYHGDQKEFPTHQRRTLNWLATHFTFIYCWLFDNVICRFKISNERFRTDFLCSSNILMQQMMDEFERVDDDIYKEIELPF